MEINTLRRMQLAILQVLSTTSKEHKINLIGRTYQRGSLELSLNTTFDADTRELADRAFEALKTRSLIRPTYSDLMNPELWVEITSSGMEALARGTIDQLDSRLLEISPHLVEVRSGAWEAVSSGRSDSLRQAAHSGRELIDQVLKEGAPDDLLKQEPNFIADKGSSTGITRKHRLKYLTKKYKGTESSSSLRIAEEACDLVLAVDDNLKNLSHSRHMPPKQDIINAFQTAEIALRAALLPDENES